MKVASNSTPDNPVQTGEQPEGAKNKKQSNIQRQWRKVEEPGESLRELPPTIRYEVQASSSAPF